MKFIVGIVAVVIVGIVGLITLFGSWYSVDPGDEAVLLNFGNPVATEGPGFHFKMPYQQSVLYISMQSRYWDFNEESYSRDQQPAQIKFSVNFHVTAGEAQNVVTTYTTFDKLTERVLVQRGSSVMKNVFGTYDAQTAIQNRAKLNADVLAALQAAVEGTPMSIESVQIKDIKFSPDYEAAINAKQQATVRVQEQQQILDQEIIKAKVTVTQAQAAADSQLAIATANAKAVQITGEAQAAAIKAKGDALKDNPALIEFTKADKWNGQLPTTMLPNATVPFIDAARQ